MGLRGSHAGSFEVAHAVANSGAVFGRPEELSDSVYDLVIVGGGISGLSAAKLFHDQAGAGKKILVLDNHDDFGGHAKRNEFEIDGRTLLCYGGSQSLESPGAYSTQSKQLLGSLGVVPQRFYDYFDQGFWQRQDMRDGVFFSKESYGEDVTLTSVIGFGRGVHSAEQLREIVARYPISAASRESLLRLLIDDEDYVKAFSQQQKVELLRSISYSDYLRSYTTATEEVISFLRDCLKGYWGFGFDALSALEGYRLDMPGTQGLGIDLGRRGVFAEDEPYIFHFPDGNASIARLLVRDLLPGAVPGSTMEDIVTARLDYSQLDQEGATTRVRLNSTAIDVVHTADRNHVDVTYVRNGEAERVRARHVILACYNVVIPHICSELPAEQVEAIHYAEKTPLAYISIALRNWQAFKNLGLRSIYQPDAELMYAFSLDFPVSMGGYEYTSSPDKPAVLHGTFAPSLPDKGLSQKQQNRAGRARLLAMSFDEFEHGIVTQLDRALGAGGFDSKRDIAGITVNRWPHGYAYEYNELFDPPDFGPQKGPHIAGRARIGRISIANSDASAYAYVDGAIDAAVRAVKEQLSV
jgi:spermidine dehydrogenase